jgi:hypothetical protein
MSLKSVDIAIGPEGGRDSGKVFTITEMPSRQAEIWAASALCALQRAGAKLSDEVLGAGMAGLAYVGVQAIGGIQTAEFVPLMDEMMSCVKVQTPGNPLITMPLIENGLNPTIMEVRTRLRLRMEVLNLHLGFSIGANPFKSQKTTPELAPTSNSSTAPTSPAQSPRRSRLEGRHTKR